MEENFNINEYALQEYDLQNVLLVAVNRGRRATS